MNGRLSDLSALASFEVIIWSEYICRVTDVGVIDYRRRFQTF